MVISRVTVHMKFQEEEFIDVLSEVIHSGYNMHQICISGIEGQVDMSYKN
jgi:hypothetical protein